MGRIKEISRKSAHTRKRNPVVYLICEGSETEIRYFKRFRSRGCNIDIIPISSQYKSADRLVQKAKATIPAALCKSASGGRRLSGADSFAETAKQNPRL